MWLYVFGLSTLHVFQAPSSSIGAGTGALREIGSEDLVILAGGDETQPFAKYVWDDIDERWL